MDAAQARREALLLRRLGHQLGPESEAAWDLLELAADLETRAHLMEKDMIGSIVRWRDFDGTRRDRGRVLAIRPGRLLVDLVIPPDTWCTWHLAWISADDPRIVRWVSAEDPSVADIPAAQRSEASITRNPMGFLRRAP